MRSLASFYRPLYIHFPSRMYLLERITRLIQFYILKLASVSLKFTFQIMSGKTV